MKMQNYKYHEFIDSYIDGIRNGEIISGEYLIKAMDLVEKKLDDSEVFIDSEKIYDCKRVIEENFNLTLFDWQLFVIGILHCFYPKKNSVVFTELLLYLGRGGGKNAFVSALSWYFASPNYGVDGYNIEITANNERQAKTSFMDIHKMLEGNPKKMKNFFKWSLTSIKSIQTNSTIEYNTSNARTKDGLRPGCVIFDEIHEYEDYDTISVFTSALGKIPHDRTIYITTNGYIRGGVLDQELGRARSILNGEEEDLGFLPLIYELDNEDEVHNEELWNKANPSLKYLPNLQDRIRREYARSKRSNTVYIELMTKRMNLPKEDNSLAVADWSLIEETNQPIPYEELKGMTCIGALDYAEVHDFASVGLLFKKNGKRYFIEHTFVCHKSLKMESRRIKFPVQEMELRGLVTIINEDAITPQVISDWFLNKAKEYHIVDIVSDKYRAQYVRQTFEESGLPLSEVRRGPITHTEVAPTLDLLFAQKRLVLGDNPTMRWYINNTYKKIDGKGNIEYLKIEPVTRKTDGFFALIHALSKDGELQEADSFDYYGGVRTY